MAKYQSVNSAWPEGTNEGRSLKPTPQEALSAAKRLYRIAMKKPFRGEMKLTSGRRYTWIRNGVFYVNPDYRGGGWHEIVHLISHYACHRLFPNAKGHGVQHAFLERELIAEVIKRGWLDGKLKRPEKAKADPIGAKAARIESRLKAWTAKQKRAATAIKKLERQRRYYAKRAPASDPQPAAAV